MVKATTTFSAGAGRFRADWLAQQKGRKATLYIIQLSGPEGELFYKVGITYRGISGRFRHRSGPYLVRTVATFKSGNAGRIFDLEQRLHQQFAALRYTPRHRFDGHTECFIECASLVAALPADTFLLRWAKAQFSLAVKG